jgi:hypothetical protein
MRGAGVLLAVLLLTVIPAPADPAPNAGPTPVATQATNEPVDVTVEDDPTNTTKTLSEQATYTGATYGPGNFTVTQIISRLAAFRIGKSLARVSLPRLQTINGVASGFGDLQAFYLFQERARTGAIFVGVFAQFPTATIQSPPFGTGKWLVGPAAAYIFAYKPRRELAGVLLQTAFSVAGAANRSNQSAITFLPFGALSIGRGWFLKWAEGPWVFDLEHGAAVIPLGVGIGRLINDGGQPLLVSVSGETTVLHANAINAPKNTVRLTLTVFLTSVRGTR